MLSCRVIWFVYRRLYIIIYSQIFLSGYEITAFYLIKNIIIRALHKLSRVKVLHTAEMRKKEDITYICIAFNKIFRRKYDRSNQTSNLF